jgi:hypothetical protein
LDKRQVIDLLPDRSVEGLQTWLEKHPGVEVITRDRCGIYAEAVEHGAADAVQVADRFHLFLNLSTAVERALEERSRELCISVQPELEAVQAEPPIELRTTLAEQRKQQRRQRRRQRYERVIELHRLGHTQRAISLEVGIERKPFAVGCAPASFRNGSQPLAVAAMSASFMTICSNAGLRGATTRLAYFTRSRHMDIEAVARWFPITFHPGGLRPDRSPRRKRKS